MSRSTGGPLDMAALAALNGPHATEPFAATGKGTEAPGPHWEQIEADYRAGLLSLRAIAAKDGHVTEGAIRKKARKLEWQRDLTARIRAKAEELVRNRLVRSDGPQYATASDVAEAAIVEDNAQILAHVELTQRRDVSRARKIVAALFAEVEALTASTGERSTTEVVPYEQEAAFSKAISLPVRSGTVKQLADSLRILVTLEREMWGMGTTDAPPSTRSNVIDSSKLTREERQQLRQICLNAVARAEQDAAPSELSQAAS